MNTRNTGLESLLDIVNNKKNSTYSDPATGEQLPVNGLPQTTEHSRSLDGAEIIPFPLRILGE